MKTEQKNKIIAHGENLNRIFNTGIEPLALCKKLHRLETKTHKAATDYCNGVIDCEQWEIVCGKIEQQLDKILHYTARKVYVFINGDARGYALKISDNWMVKHPKIRLHQDMGGYGIICPEIN